ncbi:prepilin peptidase [Vibrio cincinnatiensis]|uniref:prepilin peptidase n=1 Tax=Vibrio cincinnatiensis TaxID=675 RepID=UPI001EDE2DFF|nr:prepilin peptidase [Vibrio cincinnatiensis]MCG3725517.1 hypothetical protein [Vibrio cincinnatiensis]
MISVAAIILLIVISISDFFNRKIKSTHLILMAVILLLGWFTQPNWFILPYTFGIILIGLVLFYFRILAAGDSKLLAVLSLGISPEYLPLTLVGITVVGGVMAAGYLLYGLCTDLTAVRQRGIPYGVPISVVGGFAIYLSSL